jgi:hypothetical protein
MALLLLILSLSQLYTMLAQVSRLYQKDEDHMDNEDTFNMETGSVEVSKEDV